MQDRPRPIPAIDGEAVAVPTPRPASAFGAELADRLQSLAGDRIARANDDLAGIFADAKPAVQIRLLDLIAELEAISHAIRAVAVDLRTLRSDGANDHPLGSMDSNRPAGPARGAAGQERRAGVMTTPATSPTTSPRPRTALRLRLGNPANAARIDGAWWPQSRDLQVEAADLVDGFPTKSGRINRLLFSRPDWDNPTVAGRGVRKIVARRGPVKVGSFPSDDTHLMVLTMASGQRLRLLVIPSDTDQVEGERLLQDAGASEAEHDHDAHWGRWDDEHPSS